MDSKRQLTAMKNRDWSSKTQRENAKYLRNKLDMLGYKVPSYMRKGQLNEQQLEFYANRIMNKLSKMVEKEEKKRERRRYRPRETNKQKLERLVKELNSKLDDIHNYIDDNFSGQIAEYLKGNMAQLSTRDKSFARDKFDASKINLENFVYEDVKSAIKMVQARLNITSLDKFIDSLNSQDSDEWLQKQLLDDSLLDGLGSRELSELKRQFNDLSAVQKEFYIKDYLSELRDKYKKMEDQAIDDGDYFDYDKVSYIIYNRMISSMDTYKSI